MLKITLTILTLLFLVSCVDKTQKAPTNPNTSISPKKEIPDTAIGTTKVKATDYAFFSDSVLHGHRETLKFYFSKYNSDTCNVLQYDKARLIKDFEGLLFLGDIKKNKTKDSVFVLEPLTYCKSDSEKFFDGQAYYFTDTTLPRLQTDSYCCHPSNIFLVGDIDEDGVSEIGQYFSSCSSHYKSLLVWTLKNNHWKQIGNSTFDQHYMTYDKPFSSYIKKVEKNKFEMLEITDLTDDKTKIGKQNWKKFSM